MVDEAGERELLQRRALGYGLACDPILPGVDIGRDIRLTRGPSGLDFAVVSGIENLTQSLSVALTTLQGSDIFNVSFGFDGLNAIAEETSPIMMRERIRIGIIQLLRRDPRVRSIVDVQLEDGRLTGAAPARILDVRVMFEVVSGERVTVKLGQVVT
jgi:phage baseplate assembly protein W